jgi:nitrate reductase NapAB chaperone NapD
VLINALEGKRNDLAKTLSACDSHIEGVGSVQRIQGPFDLAIVVEREDELRFAQTIAQIEANPDAQTVIACRYVYDPADLPDNSGDYVPDGH